ncbi:hypothetical protein QYE76_038253 [Lolium multiflorum]|uniref:CCHC-type domain-containing protein n=1 Tax=Lolium multiflorum TaxID=4521 RepID=A0AAD8T769_LOLMU|nr:hypothetical protein QYE76_038253 [Lolium multiflorum]
MKQTVSSTASSKASTGPSSVTCFKCGTQGHKSFECKNTKVMITMENGDIETLDEEEYEALVQAAVESEEAYEQECGEDPLLCEHDPSPSLVVTRVLTTQPHAMEEQRCNIFQTRAGIGGKSIKFAYNRAKHSTTSRSPFMVVYGFEPLTALDILPLPLHERINMDFDKRTAAVKKLHEETRATIQEHVRRQATRLNAKKKERIFQEGDLVWIHLRKERFPHERNSKLKPRGDGPFKVLKRINNNAYVIDIPTSKYLVTNTFNVADLSPYHEDEEEQESRRLFPKGR